MTTVWACSRYDYASISGPTGPVAYPAGFCWWLGYAETFQVFIAIACDLPGCFLTRLLSILNSWTCFMVDMRLYGALRALSLEIWTVQAGSLPV